MFDTFIVLNGFKRCEYDNYVYLRSIENGSIIYLLLHVNDMLVACKRKEEIQSMMKFINS